MLKGIFIWSLFLLLTLTGCIKEETLHCYNNAIVSNDQFQNGPNDPLEIHAVNIQDECIHIRFSSGGCDGSTWITKLIGSEDILESFPPQRVIRLSLKNEEPCDAYLTKEVTFNIKPLQTGGHQIILHLDNWDEPINFVY
jgi:hypothetical protein